MSYVSQYADDSAVRDVLREQVAAARRLDVAADHLASTGNTVWARTVTELRGRADALRRVSTILVGFGVTAEYRREADAQPVDLGACLREAHAHLWVICWRREAGALREHISAEHAAAA